MSNEILKGFFFIGEDLPVGLLIGFWVIFSILTGIILLSYFIWIPEQEKKDAQVKSLIDSSSCQQLGKWIIDNSADNAGKYQSKNYVYAQAKYLVCTHGGTQP